MFRVLAKSDVKRGASKFCASGAFGVESSKMPSNSKPKGYSLMPPMVQTCENWGLICQEEYGRI
jgi:hypothetical protein